MLVKKGTLFIKVCLLTRVYGSFLPMLKRVHLTLPAAAAMLAAVS